MFYFCNVSSGGAATKVIGRSQTLSVEARWSLEWIFEMDFTTWTYHVIGRYSSFKHTVFISILILIYLVGYPKYQEQNRMQG